MLTSESGVTASAADSEDPSEWQQSQKCTISGAIQSLTAITDLWKQACTRVICCTYSDLRIVGVTCYVHTWRVTVGGSCKSHVTTDCESFVLPLSPQTSLSLGKG